MNVNQKALEAIRHSGITGARLANLLEQMATGTEAVGSPGGLLILSYIDPANMPKEGELAPTITLALKPFTTRPPVSKSPADEKPPGESE